MINTIGEMAGHVFRELETKGELTSIKLKTALKADEFILNAAIGWLARENKVDITKTGKSIKIALKG
jgi:hypothetical protein